jgi:hypothetical protein
LVREILPGHPPARALPFERAWRVASLWEAFARKFSLKRADRVLHRQPGRPLVGVRDRNEPAKGLLIINFDSDFVVIVKLNRGTTEPMPVQYFVIPTGQLSTLKRSAPPWGKINFSAIPNFQSYLNEWHRIRAFLQVETPTEPDEEESTET